MAVAAAAAAAAATEMGHDDGWVWTIGDDRDPPAPERLEVRSGIIKISRRSSRQFVSISPNMGKYMVMVVCHGGRLWGKYELYHLSITYLWAL